MQSRPIYRRRKNGLRAHVSGGRFGDKTARLNGAALSAQRPHTSNACQEILHRARPGGRWLCRGVDAIIGLGAHGGRSGPYSRRLAPVRSRAGQSGGPRLRPDDVWVPDTSIISHNRRPVRHFQSPCHDVHFPQCCAARKRAKQGMCKIQTIHDSNCGPNGPS